MIDALIKRLYFGCIIRTIKYHHRICLFCGGCYIWVKQSAVSFFCENNRQNNLVLVILRGEMIPTGYGVVSHRDDRATYIMIKYDAVEQLAVNNVYDKCYVMSMNWVRILPITVGLKYINELNKCWYWIHPYLLLVQNLTWAYFILNFQVTSELHLTCMDDTGRWSHTYYGHWIIMKWWLGPAFKVERIQS